MARTALSDPARPPGMPLYFRDGDNPELYKQAEAAARKWAQDGMTDDELDRVMHRHFASGDAERAARAAGHSIESVIRGCWYARDCFRHEQSRRPDADRAAAIEQMTIRLADLHCPSACIREAVLVLGDCIGIEDHEAIQIARDAWRDARRAAA